MVLFDLNGILDLSSPIIHPKLDNTFIILQPSHSFATQWERCCQMHHIARANKMVLDIYFLNEEIDVQDTLELTTVTHPCLDGMPESLKSDDVRFHYITWRSLTYSKRADNEYKIKVNKTSKPSNYPEFSHIVLDTSVTNLRTSNLSLEKRFVLPIGLIFILNFDIYFKYTTNPPNGYHHFNLKTSDKLLKQAICAMQTHYQYILQYITEKFDDILAKKINRQYLFYEYDTSADTYMLSFSNNQLLLTPNFYTPIHDEVTIKYWLTETEKIFIKNIDEYKENIEEWFKEQSRLAYHKEPNCQIDDFLTYLKISKKSPHIINKGILEDILKNINSKYNQLSAFKGDLSFASFINGITTWKKTSYEKILFHWVRVPTKKLFFTNIFLIIISLVILLLTSTEYKMTTNLANPRFIPYDNTYLQITLLIAFFSITFLSLIIWQIKRNNVKSIINNTLKSLEIIQKETIDRSNMFRQKYNHQLEALVLAQNQDLIYDILTDYQEYQEKLEFIKKTLYGYQSYMQIEDIDGEVDVGALQVNPEVLFEPIKSIDFLQWGFIKNDMGEVQIHNLNAYETIEKSNDFYLMKKNLFGIQDIQYK